MCVFTLQQGGYEGRGHTAGAQQHSVTHLKLPLRDPPKNHSCYSSQEAHHSSLNLEERGRGVNYCILLLIIENEHCCMCDNKQTVLTGLVRGFLYASNVL